MAAPQAEIKGSHVGYPSHPDSGESSPRSRGPGGDNPFPPASWDDAAPALPPPPPHSLSHRHGAHHPAAQRLKFMCSYGGRIQPRAYDNQLSYVGGDTKIVAVDRWIRYAQLLTRLAALMPTAAGDVCFKYQLPGEDLDALISVTDDEDVEHMIIEYDRLQRPSIKPARLRLFLFPVTRIASGLVSAESKSSSEGQWFVDVLNSVPTLPATVSLAPPVPPSGSAISNPDFLFGLDGRLGTLPPPLVIHDLAPEGNVSAETSPTGDGPPATTESDSTRDDNCIGGGWDQPAVHQPEIQSQIQELQTLQIGGQQETLGASHQTRRESTNEENRSSAHAGEYSQQPKGQEIKDDAPVLPQIPAPAYLHGRMPAEGGVYASFVGMDRQVYLIPSPTPRPIYSGTILQALTGHPSPAYYAASKPSVTSDAALRNSTYMMAPPPPPQPSAKTIGACAKQTTVEASGISTTALPPPLLAAYDNTGRPLYYVTPGLPAAGSVMPAYPAQRAPSEVDAIRSVAPAQAPPPPPPQLTAPAAAAAAAVTAAQLVNPEGKAAAKPLQAS